MRLILATIITAFHLVVFAQIQITDSLIETFLIKKIDHINTKLFKAAIEQQVPIYVNDSFSRTLTKPELLKKFSTENVYQITDRDYPGDIMDTTIYAPLNPSKDLLGLRLSYIQTANIENGLISYKVKGIGPRYHFVVSGIDLGYSALFYVEFSDLKEVFNDEDLLLLKAILLQNSQLGDFRSYYVKEEYIDTLDVAYDNAVYSTQTNQQAVLRDIDYEHKTPIISEYNRHVISVIMARIASDEIASHEPRNNLYENIKLKKAYSNPERNLCTVIKANIEINNDDITNYVDTTIVCSPWFFKPFNYTVWQKDNDFIFDFTYEHGSDQPDDHIFMSFNAVKSLFPEQDGIVWEVFLKDLFSQE